MVDRIHGKGQYVGTYLAWGVHNNCWWGEEEIKFFMDGDTYYPTVCGTGTEDYFCGPYDFTAHTTNPSGVSVGHYAEFTSPYFALAQVLKGDGHYTTSERFGLYRGHITDPIQFDKGLRVTIQPMGWRRGHYRPLQDDISSTGFWYQTEPHVAFPSLPRKDLLEVN